MEARMSKHTTGGFALLEIVVALGLLAVSTVVIVQALGAAFEYLRAARAARRATAVAAAVAHTFDDDADYPAGWRVAGTPGADALPGTRDDGPPDAPGITCSRRVVSMTRGAEQWAWIEARCAPGDGAADGSPTFVGGRLAAGALLLRGRR
jgi:type II secretory pathway pseudopilin PulG